MGGGHHRPCAAMIHFFSPAFSIFSYKNLKHFSPTVGPHPPLVFPISANTALRKTLTYPSTLKGRTPNTAARFMTYPKL